MIRPHIPRAHPPLVIAGAVWRRWLIGTRIVTITLPLINFGRDPDMRIRPTIMATVYNRPRGRHVV